MSKRKSGLNINGILLLDKSIGLSSNQALQQVRRLFNANKAGHTGSLDPLATGLLPICFGEATKICGFLLDQDKRYQVQMHLGIITDTGDAEGKILQQQSVPNLSNAQLNDCLAQFRGEIKQLPPMYSALKYQGQKYYELARQGIEIERQPRLIKINELHLLNWQSPFLTLEVACSKGTYIRSLAIDIGQILGCGATVSQLRRLQVGQFTLNQARSFDHLARLSPTELAEQLLAVDQPLNFLPKLELSSQQALAIQLGQSLFIDTDQLGQIRLYHHGAFLGLGECLFNGKLAPKKLFHLTPSAIAE